MIHNITLFRHRATVCLALMIVAGALNAQDNEFYGKRGGFTVFSNPHGFCIATKEIRYTDIQGGSYNAALAFGIGIAGGDLLTMIGIRSPTFGMTPFDSRRGIIEFDGDRFSAMYVADHHDLLTAYLEPERISEIMYSHDARFHLFDGTYIEIPLDGTLAASQLVGDCFEEQVSGPRGRHDPFGR